MVMYHFPSGVSGCMTCGSDRCGEFRCYTYPTKAELKYERRLELRREAENRVGKYEPRYEVTFRYQECNRTGWHYSDTKARYRFFSYERAEKAAQDMGLGDDPEWDIRIWDRVLQCDVTNGRYPSSRWPRYIWPDLHDPIPF